MTINDDFLAFRMMCNIKIRLVNNTWINYPKNRVSQPQDGGKHGENAIDHVEWYAQHIERQSQGVEFVYV